MFTQTMKWVSAGALIVLLPLLWMAPLSSATLLIAILVWTGAIAVFVQALSADRFIWAAGFALVFVAFNPIVSPIFSRGTLITLDLFSMAAFASSIVFLKTTPRRSLASVTDTAPRSEAL